MAHPHSAALDTSAEKKLAEVSPATFRRLFAEMWAFKTQMLLGFLAMTAASVAGLAGPYLLKVGIDEHVARGDRRGLLLIALAMAGVYLINWAATYAQTYVMTWTGQHVIHRLRMRLFGHLQRLSLRYFERTPAGAVMSRVINDIDALNQFVSGGLVNLVADTFQIVGIIAIMVSMHPAFAAVSLLTIPLLLIVTRFFTVRMRAAFQRQRQRIAEINTNLQESIAGMRVTQSFVREGENLARFEGLNQRAMEANLRAAGWFALFFPTVEVISALGTALVLWYGGARLIARDPGVSVGVLAAFLAYLTRLFAPVRDLSQFYNVLQAAAVASERIYELLDQRPDVADRPGASGLPPVAGHVRFERVTFGYDPARPVLREVSIEARPGETIALVGPTGAGKTSIISLLARFYEPQAGRITVDGHDIAGVTLRSLRRQFGIVLQDTFLFSGSVADNIRYGRPGATDATVEAAARTVGAHDFIARLPDGYATEVHERGAILSAGQRQLIAFARALLADPRVLILDEATSSVDAATEARIVAALDRLLAGRTAIVIAHRLSTVRRADRIYVIEDGRVVEQGRHDELLARGGRYAALYRQQFAEGGEPERAGTTADQRTAR